MNRVQLVYVLLGLGPAMSGCAADASVLGAEDAPAAVSMQETDLTYDPFEGDMPELMNEAMEKQLAGGLLDIRLQRELFDYTRAHPGDARPWLLLGRDSMA